MRVFVAGATGVVGKRLVPALVAAGHQVTAMTRSAEKADMLRQMDADPVVADVFDSAAVVDAVRGAGPDVVMHQLTALSQSLDMRKFAEAFEETNRLRTEGLDNLMTAARQAGAGRFIAQSFTGWPYAREGGPVKTEEDPLDPSPAPGFRSTLSAIQYLEQKVVESQGMTALALRYGFFYGPGSSLGPGGAIVEGVKAGKFPIIGGGGGVWSFVHVDDAASATVAAVERGAGGLYNVVDDDPAPVSEWLPYLAETLGANRPRSVPAIVARPLIGATGVAMMTEIRGASNAKARRELGWNLIYPSWREGFRSGMPSA